MRYIIKLLKHLVGSYVNIAIQFDTHKSSLAFKCADHLQFHKPTSSEVVQQMTTFYSYLQFLLMKQRFHNFVNSPSNIFTNILISQFQFIVLALVSAASADRLDTVFLPPHAGSSGGVSAGLQAPFGGQTTYNGGAGSASSQAQILQYENEINEDGYHYLYETSDGTKAEQQGGCNFFNITNCICSAILKRS